MTDAKTQRVRRALFTLLAAALLSTPALSTPARAADGRMTASRSIGAAIFDVAVLRPFGFAALVVGSAAFLPIALITWPNGVDSVIEAREILIDRPAQSVFQRELGDF